MLPYTYKRVCNLVDSNFNPQNLPRNVWHAIQILTSKSMVPLSELMAEGFTQEFGHENMRKKTPVLLCTKCTLLVSWTLIHAKVQCLVLELG